MGKEKNTKAQWNCSRVWLALSYDFHYMIINGIEEVIFHKGVTKRLISLIPKDNDLKNLSYLQPITLFTTIYKTFAKTLQLRLQMMLNDVISLEQMTFLPLRFILDNIVLTPETLHWAKPSRKFFVYLQLEFSKAYDRTHGGSSSSPCR